MKIALLLAIIILSSCGAGSGSGLRVGRKSASAKVLTEAEKKIFATTTLYYVETFSEVDVNNCSDTLKVNMLDRQGQILIRACKKVFDSCSMEGTCQVSIQNKMTMLNVDGRLQNIRRFRNITGNECKYGRGASSDGKNSYKNMCVDPFYSVAADFSIYHLGDVIYLPSVRGTVLPNGQIHDGYFVVRDNGGGINGYGRFDFFTGFYTTKTKGNSFAELKLNGLQIFPEYFVITGSESDRVRKDRNFPLLPK
jgi:3D (Asp-Asp-Asp) domain-containing protein